MKLLRLELALILDEDDRLGLIDHAKGCSPRKGLEFCLDWIEM